MLLHIGIGDAYGAGFEFSSRDKINKYNDLTTYCEHDLGLPAGNYTDDTQMSLAISELLIDQVEWTRSAIADKFVECFKRDVRFGYSKGFQAFLTSVESGDEFLEKMRPDSTRNGAAMRSAPLGVVRDIPNLLAMSRLQAELTHDTEIGVKSSQAVALASHYFLYGCGPKSELTEFVSEHTKSNWLDNWSAPVACCGEETVNALLTVLKKCESLEDVLLQSVELGGDVDTVAAVGLGIASQSVEFSKELPEFLYTNLENEMYGRDYLAKVGRQLMALVQC